MLDETSDGLRNDWSSHTHRDTYDALLRDCGEIECYLLRLLANFRELAAKCTSTSRKSSKQ